MGRFVVLTEPLAMVRRQHDQRALAESTFLERVDDASDLMVGVADFGVVVALLHARSELDRRLVRNVRIEIVQP